MKNSPQLWLSFHKRFSRKFSLIVTIAIIAGIGLTYQNCGSIETQEQAQNENSSSSLTALQNNFAAKLSLGLNHPDVKVLQEYLTKEKYFRGKVDGVFGKDTEEAVKKLQDHLGIKSTGIVDNTWQPKPPQPSMMPPVDPITACDVDFNQDGIVAVSDFLFLMQYFGTGPYTYFVAPDLNEDYSVNTIDLLLFIPFYGLPANCSCTWIQEAYIKASNAEADDLFGSYWGVSISGDTIIVGAIEEDSNQTTITNGTGSSTNNSSYNSGAVYVYKRSGNNWTQEAYIKAINANAGDRFGAVAIDQDTIVVGAGEEDSNQTTITNGTAASADNSASASGAAYVYKRTGTAWAQEAYIKASNANGGDSFGRTVSISGDTIAIGAYYESSNQTTISNGAGSSSDNSLGASGAAYVYKRAGNAWAQEAYIKASNANGSDLFGTSISITENTLVVGAYGEDSSQTTVTNGTGSSSNNDAIDSGAAYVYQRTGNTWAQQAYIKASNATSDNDEEYGNGFGTSVGISQHTIVVGTGYEDGNQTIITNGAGSSSDYSLDNSGAAYVYKRTGNTWAQEAYLKASNANSYNLFGTSVGISEDRIVVGALGEGSNQTTITNGTGSSSDTSLGASGAAYVYKRTGNEWAQEAYIKASNANSGDIFGVSVSISEDTIVVGAFEDSNQTSITNGPTSSSDNSASSSGAAYVYRCVE